MNALSILAAGAILLSGGVALAEPAAPDGKLLSTTSCQPNRQTYEEWKKNEEKEYVFEARAGYEKFGIELRPFSALRPLLPDGDEFDRRRNHKEFLCERIVYWSEGLKVIGYIWRPAGTDGKKLPLVVYNRGGGQEIGKLKPGMHDGFYDFLSAGFVVIGSQYRGNDGGEGHDEEGGAEIADVLNLLPLAESLGYVDTSHVFMFGESRGGMMTFLAMKKGMRLDAAAVLGAESDLAANIAQRPELEEDNRIQIPEYATDREGALRRRSAQAWPEAISAPLLILQGGKDWRVPPAQALGLARALEGLKKPYELAVYADDDHSLSFHWRERDRRIVEWFKAHLAGAHSVGDVMQGSER